MRVLLVQPGASFSVQDVHDGWCDGLRELGVTVADLNLGDRLALFQAAHVRREGEWERALPTADAAIRLAAHSILSDCYTFWPDVLIVTTGFFVPHDILDLIRSRGTKVVYLFTESPYEDDQQLARAGHADLVLLNDPTNLERFRQVTDAYYVPHAYNPARHYSGAPVPGMESDFAFVGTGFPSRVEFFEQVDWDGIDVVLGGMWRTLTDDSPLRRYVGHDLLECVDNAITADVYRSTKTSLNLYRTEHSDHPDATGDGVAVGPREVELAACGTWFARDPRPESDDLFPMLPTFSEPGEVRSLIDWALAHDLEREEAAAKAQAAIADRTFANNARWLLNKLDK